MQLPEYKGKLLFRKHGIPIPKGSVATNAEEAFAIADSLAADVVVKAQVLTGGRGKAGGIAIAHGPDETRIAAGRIIGMSIKGNEVKEVLIEEALRAKKEYYAGIAIDRHRKAIAVILCSEGGIDIEEVAKKTPEKIKKFWLSPLDWLSPFKARAMAVEAGFARASLPGTGAILSALFKLFILEEASLAEINPLILTEDGKVIAADSKIVLDDNAAPRFSVEASSGINGDIDELEEFARSKKLSYVKLDGEIGVIGNGAGLVMATLDAISSSGGKGADFLDIGGGAKAEVVRNAMDLLLMDRRIKAILINIFGGITRCDEVAAGLLEALAESKVGIPIVVRLAGTAEQEGTKLLDGAPLIIAQTMEGAADLAVKAARGWPDGHSGR